MYTRTYTRYFNEDDVIRLREIHNSLFQDWSDRSPYIDSDVVVAGHRRLQMLLLAIDTLVERVAE